MFLCAGLIGIVERHAKDQPRPFQLAITDALLREAVSAALAECVVLKDLLGEPVDPVPIRAMLNASGPADVKRALIENASFRRRDLLLSILERASADDRMRAVFTVPAADGPILCDVSTPPGDWPLSNWLLMLGIRSKHARNARAILWIQGIVSRMEAATRRWKYNVRGWRTIP